ncbi:MAG: glycosyltransferase family 39 protein [Elusimicrobiota bacterium]
MLFPQAAPGGGVMDIDNYHSLAQSLLAQGSLLNADGQRTANREPGYPILLAGLYAAAGPRHLAVVLLNAVLGAASVGLLWLVGLRIFGIGAAWSAAVLAAVHPQLVYYSAMPRRETFQVFLIVLGCYLLLELIDRPSLRRSALAAGVWAFHALTNSVFLPAGLAAAAAVWWIGRRKNIDLRRQACFFLIVYLALYSLWPLRNYQVFGRFIPGITGGGSHLYVSLVVPDQAAGTPAEQRYVDADPVMQAAGLLKEEQRDALFYREASARIRRHPGEFIRRMVQSGIKLWRPFPYERDYGMDYRFIRWVSIFSDGWILPAALLGMFLSRKRPPEALLLSSMLIAITSAYMVFWAVIRYRVPLMPIIFLYAGHAISSAGRRIVSRTEG